MDNLMSLFRRGSVKGLNRRGIVGDDMRLNRRRVVGDGMRCVMCIYESLSLDIEIGRLPYRRLWERL